MQTHPEEDLTTLEESSSRGNGYYWAAVQPSKNLLEIRDFSWTNPDAAPLQDGDFLDGQQPRAAVTEPDNSCSHPGIDPELDDFLSNHLASRTLMDYRNTFELSRKRWKPWNPFSRSPSLTPATWNIFTTPALNFLQSSTLDLHLLSSMTD